MIRFTLALACATLLVTGCSKEGDAAPAGANTTLRIAILPDEDQAKIFRDYQTLVKHLESVTGRKVELVQTTSYQAMVEAIRGKRIEVGYFGPLSYVIARNLCEIEPFAAKKTHGAVTYQSVLLVQADSPIQSIADVKGKNVGFGDPASTSSHLFPKAVLSAAGLKPGADYNERFLGKHDAVALNVQQGNIDVGGLSEPILEGLLDKGTIDRTKVRVLAKSDPIIQYPWAMRTDLAEDLKASIRKAILEFNDAESLKAMKIEGFAPVKDEDYEGIRKVAKILGLELTKFDN